jgi:hypothetical protein
VSGDIFRPVFYTGLVRFWPGWTNSTPLINTPEVRLTSLGARVRSPNVLSRRPSDVRRRGRGSPPGIAT